MTPRQARRRAIVRAVFWVVVLGFAWFALSAVEAGMPYGTLVALTAGAGLLLIWWGLSKRTQL